MDLQVFRFKVTGLLPLLTHNPAGMGAQSNGPKTKKIPTKEEEAKQGLYIDADGNFCLPSMAFRSSFLNGLKNKRIGKASAISVMQAAIFNVDEFCVLIDPDTEKPLTDYTIDSRRAIVQRQGITRNRPRFEKWGCYLNLDIDLDITQAEQVEENLNVAGQIIGVGDFRIERRGIFGRYKAELM